MNQVLPTIGTSYGSFRDFAPADQLRNQEEPNIWDIFNDVTSPRGTVETSTIMDAMTSFCAASVLPHAMPRVAEDTLLSLEVPHALAEIRHFLSLSTVELSKIFSVSRRAIYDWFDGKNVTIVNRQRIAEVHGIAKKWEVRELGNLGSLVREEVQGHPLSGLLCSHELDQSTIAAWLNEVAARLILAEANRTVPTAEELLKRNGATPLTGQAYRRNLKAARPRRR